MTSQPPDQSKDHQNILDMLKENQRLHEQRQNLSPEAQQQARRAVRLFVLNLFLFLGVFLPLVGMSLGYAFSPHNRVDAILPGVCAVLVFIWMVRNQRIRKGRH